MKKLEHAELRALGLSETALMVYDNSGLSVFRGDDGAFDVMFRGDLVSGGMTAEDLDNFLWELVDY